MRARWARVSSSYSCHNFSIFHNILPKDQSSGDNGANADTEVVRVASLSATFEGRCILYVPCRTCVTSDSSATVSIISDSEGGRMITTRSFITSEHTTGTTTRPSTSTKTSTMFQVQSSTSFETIFTAALNEYRRETSHDLTSHPLTARLRS